MRSLLQNSLLCLACLFGISIAGWSQDKLLSGKVLAGSDSALQGVTVQVKGKPAATSTDALGSFRISASSGDVLIFSYTGFANREITVGANSVINVSMRIEATSMDDVVVIGYGTASRRNVTGAIGKLDKTVLQNAPRANVGSALQGTLAGLTVVNSTGAPGATPALILRGGASINTPGAPLVVVDGTIRSFEDIPSDDIESIELLKDAASTAIYGARANNGVVLITTKSGKAGKAQISYKYLRGSNINRTDYSYLGTKDYIYYSRLGHLNSQRTLAQANSQRGFGLSTNAADLALFDIKPYGPSTENLLQAGWDTVSDPYGGTIIFKDHAGEIDDLLFRKANTNEHYVSVNGGNEKGKYFASFDYYNEEGIIVGSDYKRYTGNINGSYKIKPRLEINTGVNLSTSSGLGLLGGDVNTLYRNGSLWPTMNPWLDSAKTKPNPGNGLTDGNPLYWLDKNYRKNEVNRISVNGSLKYDIMKDLYLKVSANIYYVETINESFTKATQTYTQIYANPQIFNTTRPAILSQQRSFQQDFDAVLNYSKSIASVHNINVMVGLESFDRKLNNSRVYGTGAPTDDIPSANASTIFAPGNNFSTKSEYRINSTFGRINYNYDERYLLTMVYRYDGISSLAEKNRWGFFPGLSAGWNMHNEEFYKNTSFAKIVSTIKPRFSYGVNGNVAGIGDYEVRGEYGVQGNYNGSMGFLNTAIVNSVLRWEKSKTTDIGIDLGFLKNRITVMFDYYNRKTSDLLTNLTLPSYLGFSTLRTNLGTFQNIGYEFMVNANVLNSSSGVNIDVGGNISFIKNKILQLPPNGNENNRQEGFQVYDPSQGKVIWVAGLQQGQPLGAVYGYKQLSIFQNDREVSEIAGNRYDVVANISGPNLTSGAGKITPGDVNWSDIDKNDTIDSRDQVYIGNIYPKVTGGFTVSVSYKRFSLFTRFDYALGHVLYNDLLARVLGNYQGSFNNVDLIKKGFSGDNSMPDIPKVYWADQVGAPNGKKNITRGNNATPVVQGNNSRYYEKGDYLAIREVTLAYSFGKSILDASRILSSARIYFNANNLYYFTGFSGNSPEPKIDGVFGGTFPTPKSYALGVQVSF